MLRMSDMVLYTPFPLGPFMFSLSRFVCIPSVIH